MLADVGFRVFKRSQHVGQYQTCQASCIWRETARILLALHAQVFHTFSISSRIFVQLLTIHFFKIAAVAAQIHAFFFRQLGSYAMLVLR